VPGTASVASVHRAEFYQTHWQRTLFLVPVNTSGFYHSLSHHRRYFLDTLRTELFDTTAYTANDVTDLGKSHGQSPQLRVEIFVDDEKTPRSKITLQNHNSTFRIPNYVNL
jgi:hypothetical protein